MSARAGFVVTGLPRLPLQVRQRATTVEPLGMSFTRKRDSRVERLEKTNR